MCDLSSETIGEDFSKLMKKEPGAIRAFFAQTEVYSCYAALAVSHIRRPY
jgi:hypothetical protein